MGLNWQSYRRAPSCRAIEQRPSRPCLVGKQLFQLQSINLIVRHLLEVESQANTYHIESTEAHGQSNAS